MIPKRCRDARCKQARAEMEGAKERSSRHEVVAWGHEYRIAFSRHELHGTSIMRKEKMPIIS